MNKIVLVVGLLAGCDLAREDLAKCQKTIQEVPTSWGLNVALAQCERAASTGPESPSGLEAIRMIPEIKKAIQEAIEREAIQKAAQEVQEKVDQEAARVARLAALSRKVRAVWIRQSDGSLEDPICQGKGLGAYAREYRGGTWEENHERARLDGCSPKYNIDATDFCCSKGPY
jgi:hypothetical protein